MGYSKQTWSDGPAGGTPVSAARLQHMEDGIAEASAASVGTVVPAPAPTGVAATDTANLQAAITAAQATSQDLLLKPGLYRLNAALTWNANKGSLLATGDCVLDFTALTSGYALTITGNGMASGSYSHRGINYRIAGFRMNGPDTDTTTVDGVYITDPGVGADNVTLEHLMIYGFRDGICYGSNTWLVKHDQIGVGNCHRYGINATMGTNAGEMMHYFGCVVYGCANAAGTAVGLYVPATGPYLDLFFYGGSFDYNNIGVDINGHHVEFIGTHFEDRNPSTPMVQTSNTGGQAPTDVGFHGVSFGPTEALPGRDVLVTTKTGSTDHVQITFSGGLGGTYDSSTTLYKNQSAAFPTVKLSGLSFDQGGVTRVPQYGDFFNRLVSGGFETGSSVANGLGGWTLPAGFDFFTGSVRSGTRSLRASGSAMSGTAYQVAPIAVASPISISGYLSCSNYTSGTATFQIQFLAADRTTVLSTVALKAATANQSFIGYQRRLMPAQGAAYVSVQLVAASLTGTAVLDDVQLVSL